MKKPPESNCKGREITGIDRESEEPKNSKENESPYLLW